MSTKQPLLVSYGGGRNSTALLVGLYERGVRPDAVVFADTGGEHPETYDYIRLVARWMAERGMGELTVVRRSPSERAPYRTLEEECLQRSQLPSLAYGWHKCAEKWKVRPQTAFISQWPLAQAAIARGGVVEKAIAFHIGEARRIKAHTEPGTRTVYPLIDWRWSQEDCESAIVRGGLAMPPKSSCFFCPAKTKPQILSLYRDDPDLLDRALSIEDRARASGELITVQGLGRRFAWRSFIQSQAASQCAMPPDDTDGQPMPCGCHDGGVGEDDD